MEPTDNVKITVFDFIHNDAFIQVNKNIAHAFGIHEALIYGELLSKHLWYKKHNYLDKEGWFYATIEDMQDATTLSDKQQRTAINNLKKHGLFEYEVRGRPPKRYFKINEDVDNLLTRVESQLRTNGIIPDTAESLNSAKREVIYKKNNINLRTRKKANLTRIIKRQDVELQKLGATDNVAGLTAEDQAERLRIRKYNYGANAKSKKGAS